jgi:uncharacterized protein (TIGR03118 family)
MLATPYPTEHPIWRRLAASLIMMLLLASAAAPVVARSINADNNYTVTNLVSDDTSVIPAARQDPNLVNGWGITASGSSPWWVSNNGTGTSTLYNGNGQPFPLASPLVVAVDRAPTGTVFNTAGAGFEVSNGTTSGTSRFLFVTEDGQILGWAPTVDTSQAFVGFTADDGAIYKGLAIGADGNGFHLFAADFHNAKIDVISPTFQKEDQNGRFIDPGIPAGFAPFGIQNLNGTIFVSYAMQDADAEDEVAGDGLGFVSAFGTDGAFLGRVASHGELNAPWGLAWAPGDFGKFSGDLLVGNFGDGRIDAYALTDDGWEARGPLKGPDHRPITIDGLWGIGFGNGANSGATNILYFAAGPDDETHGLFGKVAVTPS